MFNNKIGIDLGTTNILVYLPNKGIVVQEPSVVAVESSGKKIMAIGKEAYDMLGRTPDSVTAVNPLLNGAIANFRVTEAMLKYYINQVIGKIRFTKPEVMISIPAGITSTEKRAVIDATINAGAKNAYLIKEPIAAALGANIKISTPSGHMIIDIGGGTTEVAVISLSDIVAFSSARIAGNQIDKSIISNVRKKNKLIIGKQTAENIKIKIGSCLPLEKELSMEVSGSNSITGLPESQILKTSDVIEPIKSVLN
ncbi:rod shape-determining protein, partial [Candidatus Berkelbacteria bacterium CG_4_9_14_3_um_filter_33_5]